MTESTDVSFRIAQDPVFAAKARRVVRARATGSSPGRRRAGLRLTPRGIVLMVAALWCIKIAIVAVQGPTAQAQLVARLADRAPVLAAIAAPDPLTRRAVALRLKGGDWARYIKRVM